MSLENITIQDICLTLIEWDNHLFRISTPALPPSLTDSIQAIGIINQPTVVLRGSKYVTVSGFRRLSACQRLGVNQTTVKILDAQTSNQTCAMIAVADNALQRPLNLMEQSRSYALLEAVCDNQKIFHNHLTAAGLSINNSWIHKIKSLIHLPQPIQKAVEAEFIPLAIAQLFSKMEKDPAILLTKLFQQLSLGLNKQREIIQMASEAARRNHLSLKNFLLNEELQNIIQDPHLDKNKKAANIKNWLKEQRYPNLSKAQKQFYDKRKALKLGNQVKLSPPPYFEGSTFNLSFSFSTKNDLSRMKEIIHRLEKDEYLASFLA